MTDEKKYVMWFEDTGIQDVALVGGKNASLGEMIRNLEPKGVQVPGGFSITAEAYKYYIDKAGIADKIKDVLSDLDTHDMDNLAERGEKVRNLILESEIPEDLAEEIMNFYDQMCKRYDTDEVDVAVRSSATAEDLPDASFAGQQETYLNIKRDTLLQSCKKCFSSLFTNRAISYRVDKGFGHFDVYLSIGVQKMIRSDSASSGVMFTIDTESGFKDVIFITGSWGLGENVVQGSVNPDEFYVFKPLLGTDKIPIVGKQVGEKAIQMVYCDPADNDGEAVKNVNTCEEDQHKYVISDQEVMKLAEWGNIIEEHYTQEAKETAEKRGETLPEEYLKPMDIEWAKDGDGETVGNGQLYIVQARPETVHSQKVHSKVEGGKKYYHVEHFKFTDPLLLEKMEWLVKGRAVGNMIGQGIVNNIPSSADIGKFQQGEVLVTAMTDPDWEPIMKKAAAIVTDKGGRTCHAAIISRELGIPCIVGSLDGSQKLTSGVEATVSCVEGDDGHVYEGLIPFEIKDDWMEIPVTRTKIMMNAGIPEKAFSQGQIPNDGVGLAREEFIINSYIGMHPNALLDYAKLNDDLEAMEKVQNKELLDEKYEKLKHVITTIDQRTYGYDNKVEFFVDQLARGIARIAAGFWPNDVIVRLSDFKTNEYANLVGGYLYEPTENNPMIGWRGASRYYDDNFKRAFGLECDAILKARNEMGFTNIKVMVPFCRTPTEGRKVVETMNEFGLTQGENMLEFYVMAEIPSNVIVADEFSEIFDGFSIGSNDLTQLTLGLDRDSELVAHIYDERESAVKKLVAEVIRVAKEKGRKIGICGQAPSDYDDFATFLVECGIDSISLNPDTVLDTKLKIAKKEQELGIKAEE